MRLMKHFFIQYISFTLKSKFIFHTINFIELCLIWLLFRILSNAKIDLKFFSEVVITYLFLSLLMYYSLGGYLEIKKKFDTNFKSN